MAGQARADLSAGQVLNLYETGNAAQKHDAAIFMSGMVGGLLGANAVTLHRFGKSAICTDDSKGMSAQYYFVILSDYMSEHPESTKVDAGIVFARAMEERAFCLH